MNFRKLLTYLTVGTAAVIPFAGAQNPTILQGSYISNVFGNSNFVLNPNAQTNVANVTNATRSTTTPLVATSEFTLALASGANATWTLRAFDAGMKGQNCEARFSYRGFATATSTAEIVQNSLVVAQLVLTPTTDPRIASINFPCGDLANLTTFRIAQTTANMTIVTPNEIGGIYVGLATNMANVAQAETVVIANKNNVLSVANTAQVVIPYNNEILDVYGEYNTSTGEFIAKRAGTYSINAALLMDTQTYTAGNSVEMYIKKNGNTVYTDRRQVDATLTDYRQVNAITTTQLNVGDVVTAAIYQSSGGTRNSLASTIFNQLIIKRFPSASELVVTPERQNTFAGVVYTAESQTLFSGVAEPTAFSAFNNATWNKPAKLVGKAAVTTTGSGNDLGFSVPNLPVGTYKVTISGALNTVAPTNGQQAICNFRVRETTLNNEVVKYSHQAANISGLGTRDLITASSGIFNNTALATRNFILEANKFADDAAGNTGICEAYSNSASTGTNYNTQLAIVLEPLDQPSNSALYVEGPVKASATGAAIPSGYLGQKIYDSFDIANGCTGAANTRTFSTPIPPGVWLQLTSLDNVSAGTGRFHWYPSNSNIAYQEVWGASGSAVRTQFSSDIVILSNTSTVTSYTYNCANTTGYDVQAATQFIRLN